MIKRIPTLVLQNQTPFERLFKKKPQYDHLRVIGSLCFASTLDRNKNKFSPRANPSVFIGYPPGVKGYKLLNLQTNQVFISKNVIFHEHILPLQTPSPPPDLDFFSDTLIPIHTTHASDPVSTSNLVSGPELQQVTTRSNRISKIPLHLQDYICAKTADIAHTFSLYSLASFLDYSRISFSHKAFIASVSSSQEPS